MLIQYIAPCVAGLFGLLLGSFLNVVIYRFPRRESIVFPGSHCPACDTPIKYYDNIPVLSYILLKGRCRQCSVTISWKYPFMELLTAGMVAGLYMVNSSMMNFIADVSLGFVLLAVFAIDLRHMIIPNRLNLAGGIAAFFLTFRWGMFGLLRGGAGVLVCTAILAIMIVLGHIVYKRQGIGMGDVKLGIVIGLFVGPFWSLVTFILAVLFGGLWGLFCLLSGKVKAGQEIPFGPFISLGGFCVLFLKPQILYLVEYYLSLL